jgi:hypothetical protein
LPVTFEGIVRVRLPLHHTAGTRRIERVKPSIVGERE